MVYRVFVEKKPELANDARSLLSEAKQLPGVEHLERVRILNRYDVEHITPELFDYAVKTVFSEPQVDLVTREADTDGASVFAVEYLPGQFDQRADSAAQCIQIISQGERPDVRTARVYLLYGALTDAELAAVKKHVINPVDSREASLALPETLELRYEIPTEVETLTGFCSRSDEELAQLIEERGLAMDLDDIRFCRDYFRTEQRDPTITELRMIDTNIRAVHILTKLAVQDFEKRGHGYILNVASSAGFLPGPLMATYYATKNYVLRLTQALREELRHRGSRVRVCALCPGPVDTEFNRVAGVKFSLNGLDAKRVAREAIDGLFAGRAVIVPGVTMKAMTVARHFAPDSLLARITYHFQHKKGAK